MEVDVEYRTTERIHGKAVYKKANASGDIMYRLEDETDWKLYLDAIKMVKMWENKSPTSNFATQTIKLSFAEGDMALIYFAEGTDANRRLQVIADYDVTCGVIGKYASAITTRSVKVTADGVTFTSGSRMLTYGDWSDADKVLIPTAIYKIMGVSA